MKKIFKAIILTMGVIAASGCEDFLNRYPYDQVSTNTVYKSAQMAESAVVGAYSNLLYDYVSADLSRINWDVFAGVIDPYYDNYYSNYLYLNGNVQTNASIFLTYWKRLYEGVSRSNEIITNIGVVPDMSEELKARRIAECKFIRAYHYYKLNALWGGVAIYKTNLASEEYNKPRATADEVWDFIIEDLTDCINCESLPDIYASASADFGRITKGAAYALRGKVYMWKEMWEEAEADLKKVTELGYGLLQKPYADVFKLANETSNEIIFSARMVEVSGWGNAFSRSYGCWHVAGKGGNNSFYMSRQFVDSYQNADGTDFNWDEEIAGYSDMTPEQRSVYFLRNGMTEAEKSAMESYGADMSKYLPNGNEERIKAIYAKRDPRLLATVITPYSTYNGGFSGTATDYTRRWPFRKDEAPEYDIKTKSNTNFYYTIRKFVVEGMDCLNETFNPVDIPIIRYAGVLIDLAEAINNQNRPAEAVALLNQVRSRAGVGAYPASISTQDLKEKIKWERRWELALEEVLYYDEIRQGTVKEFRFAEGSGLAEPWGTTSYKVQWGGDAYNLWPVPSKEVEMAGLKQNDGWL